MIEPVPDRRNATNKILYPKKDKNKSENVNIYKNNPRYFFTNI